MSIADKLTTIAENQQRVYAAGEAAAENRCAEKYFTAEFYGNDTTSCTINIPFEPDVITVGGYEPTFLVGQGLVFLITCDYSAFGMAGGYAVVRASGTNMYPIMLTSKSILTKCSRADNGDITFSNFTTTMSNGATLIGKFASNIKYTIVATKYTDKTDKERITEFINNLSDSEGGSLTFNQNKVNAAFTGEEWDSLIATKPSWTFAMF